MFSFMDNLNDDLPWYLSPDILIFPKLASDRASKYTVMFLKIIVTEKHLFIPTFWNITRFLRFRIIFEITRAFITVNVSDF